MNLKNLKIALNKLYFPIIAVFAAMLLGAIVMKLLDFDPMIAFMSMFSGALGNPNAISISINKAMPVIMTALSYGIAYRSGIINLGAEGQLYIGTLVATLVGTNFAQMPSILHILLTIIAGFIGGALYGSIVALLKIRFKANELITTIMLNYVATIFVSYMIAGPIKDTTGSSNFPQSRQILESARFYNVFSGTKLHVGIFVVIAALVFYYVFLYKTKKGYEVRVIGLNSTAGEYAGMNISRSMILAMVLAGGMAGLGGVIELLGVQPRLMDGFSVNFGFDGIAVALLGGNTALGIGLSGLLFGILKSGSNKMQMMTGAPIAVIYMIQGFIILFIIGRNLFKFTGLKTKLLNYKNQKNISLKGE